MKEKEHAPTAKKAVRFAALKRQVGPLVAELEQLGEELKTFFRTHPELNELAGLGFSVVNRKQLDTKAVRAHLGADIAKFEKNNPVETLFLLRQTEGAKRTITGPATISPRGSRGA